MKLKKRNDCELFWLYVGLFSNLTMLVGKSVRVKYLPYLKTLLDSKLLGGGDGEGAGRSRCGSLPQLSFLTSHRQQRYMVDTLTGCGSKVQRE